MSYFLLVYDRSTGELREQREFADEERELALAERFSREREEREHPNIEVVLLGAPSEEALRRTHARYFHDVAELVRGS